MPARLPAQPLRSAHPLTSPPQHAEAGSVPQRESQSLRVRASRAQNPPDRRGGQSHPGQHPRRAPGAPLPTSAPNPRQSSGPASWHQCPPHYRSSHRESQRCIPRSTNPAHHSHGGNTKRATTSGRRHPAAQTNARRQKTWAHRHGPNHVSARRQNRNRPAAAVRLSHAVPRRDQTPQTRPTSRRSLQIPGKRSGAVPWPR